MTTVREPGGVAWFFCAKRRNRRSPSRPWGWLRHSGRQRETPRSLLRLAGVGTFPRPRDTSSNSSSPLPSRTRGSKHHHVIRARLCLSPPISPHRWTCSPPLGATSMSRFPAVAGRAPRRQEEGERSRDPQEERPPAVSSADRGAVRGTLPWPARVRVGAGMGGIKVCLGSRGDWEGGRSVLLTLQAGGELCVQ